ncbi:MAG: hypothetical protein WA722_13115 [Candidatus Sulfotelmatobacter sp.]
MVGALYRCHKTLEASLVTPADIALRDIVATRENSISDPSQVDLNIFRPNVDQHDFETTTSRVNHHLEITLAGKRSFDRKALAFFNMLTGRNENLPAGSDRRRSGAGQLKSLIDSIGIEQGNPIDEA